MNRSLLCSGLLLLLTPSICLAGINMDNFDFSVDVGSGYRGITLNDPESSTATLLGDQKSTSSVTTAATTTSLSHMTPTAVLSGSVFMKINKGNISHGLKLGAGAHMANSNTHTIYDGQSTTAAVVLKASKPVLTFTPEDPVHSDPNTPATIADDASATVGISSITAGKRECKVDHSSAYGLSIQYAIGSSEQGLGIGVGFLKTADKYQYSVEEPPAGGTANSGVYNSSDTDFSENFIIGGTAVTDNTAITDGTTQTNPTHVQTKNFTPLTATTATYSDSFTWTGFVAETSTGVTDYISAKGAVGYYWRTFDASPNATTNAPMIVSKTDATMFTGHVSIGFSKKNSHDE